jgi:hypothetical protein
MYLTEKFVNPFTDYGFKKLFGEEPNKDLLLDFLNELLKEEQGRIVSLTYLKNEQLGRSELDRRAIFDLYCENERGEKFIVELQKTKADSDNSWTINVKDIDQTTFDLSAKNPNKKQENALRQPQEILLAMKALDKEREAILSSILGLI